MPNTYRSLSHTATSGQSTIWMVPITHTKISLFGILWFRKKF